jgi:hypothetical protein
MAQTKTNKAKSKTKDVAKDNTPKRRGRPPGSGKKK